MDPGVWLWFPLAFLPVLAAVLLYAGVFQDRSRGRPRCPRCWYNMTGAPSLRCPECGHDAGDEKRFYRTRRRRWAVVAAAVVALATAYLWEVRARVAVLEESLATAIQPTAWLLVTLPSTAATPPVIYNTLSARMDRRSLWAWERSLLLYVCDQIHSGTAAPALQQQAAWLLAKEAPYSRRVLNRLVDLTGRTEWYVVRTALSATASSASRLDDQQLAQCLDAAVDLPVWWARTGAITDPLLVEMIRRGRPEFIDQIAALSRSRRPLKRPEDWDEAQAGMEVQLLELVTALRRMEGQPDPLRILVEDTTPLVCSSDKLPVLSVTIHNVETAGPTFPYLTHDGVGGIRDGDIWSRSPRWRFDVWNERGERMPDAEWQIHGSLRPQEDVLEPGATRAVTLNMAHYVAPLPPGRYRVVVRYHNTDPMAHTPDISDRIVFSSDPFELIVLPTGGDSPESVRR